jgi:hypothetical protein
MKDKSERALQTAEDVFRVFLPKAPRQRRRRLRAPEEEAEHIVSVLLAAVQPVGSPKKRSGRTQS